MIFSTLLSVTFPKLKHPHFVTVFQETAEGHVQIQIVFFSLHCFNDLGLDLCFNCIWTLKSQTSPQNFILFYFMSYDFYIMTLHKIISTLISMLILHKMCVLTSHHVQEETNITKHHLTQLSSLLSLTSQVAIRGPLSVKEPSWR